MPASLHVFATLSVWLAQSVSKWHTGALITALLWHVSHATAISRNQSHLNKVHAEINQTTEKQQGKPKTSAAPTAKYD